MSLKQISLISKVIDDTSGVSDPAAFVESIDKDIFSRNCTGRSRDRMFQLMAYLTFKKYDKPELFKALADFSCEGLRGCERWTMNLPAPDEVDMSGDMVTEFMLRLHSLGCILPERDVKRCSEEYRMFVEL